MNLPQVLNARRSVWVEPLLAEAKDWHGMRCFRLRLLWRLNNDAGLLGVWKV